ncbi:MAG: hypothetical protein Q4Q07_06900 [Tissierellia bacterium]|nr:hypothetical protein [Tissierellia bacterium]
MDQENKWLDELLYQECSVGIDPSPELDYKIIRKIRNAKIEKKERILSTLAILGMLLYVIALGLGIYYYKPSLYFLIFLFINTSFTGVGIVVLYYLLENDSIRKKRYQS